jgi:PKHD-type hydroxylase
MFSYHIHEVLNQNQLIRIRSLLQRADHENLWIDGVLTTRGDSSKDGKMNLELIDSPALREINDVIMECLSADRKFVQFTAAKSSYSVLVSKTFAGGFYNPHTDDWANGDYSTTLFLSDPEDYEGGELCIYDGGIDETKFKLEAGWAVTYPTGMIHRVNKVSTGIRHVSVFWTKSLIKDPFIRSIFFNVSACAEILHRDHSVHLSNCKSAANDPIFMLDTVKSQILRRYSDSN